MKYQVLFSLKKSNEKMFKTVVCCSRDFSLKGVKAIEDSLAGKHWQKRRVREGTDRSKLVLYSLCTYY